MSGIGGVGQTPEIPTVQPATSAAPPNLVGGLGSILQHAKEQIEQGKKLGAAAQALEKWRGNVYRAAQAYRKNPSAANLEKLKGAISAYQGIVKAFKAAGLNTTGLQDMLSQAEQTVDKIQPGQPDSSNLGALLSQVDQPLPAIQNILSAINAADQLAHAITQGFPS